MEIYTTYFYLLLLLLFFIVLSVFWSCVTLELHMTDEQMTVL